MDRGKEDCKQAELANRSTLVLGQKGGYRVWRPRAQRRAADGTAKPKKKEKKGELGSGGSGKPYDECSEVEVTLDIPVVSWGWRRDEGEEEERIRTEEQVVRQKEEPRGQIFVCIQGHWESEKRQ